MKDPFEQILEIVGKERGGWIHPDGTVEYIDPYYPEAHWEDAFKKLKGKSKIDQPGETASHEYGRQGHIRFSTEGTREFDIVVSTEPTESQMRTIGRMAREFPDFYADISYVDIDEGVYSWEEFRNLIGGVKEEFGIEEAGRISPFGTDAEEIQAVLDGRKTISRLGSNSVVAKQALADPNLKSIKSGMSYTIFYLPENETEALARAKEVTSIVNDVDVHGGATREQMIRLGQLFDYSKDDINTFLRKVGCPIEEGFGRSLATAAAAGLLSTAPFLGGAKSIPVSPKIAYQQAVGDPRIDIDILADIESAQNPKAENKRTGARGLLQIMKPTWEEVTDRLGVSWSWNEAFDEEKNEEVGTYYINVEIPRLLKHFGIKDTLENRLAAWNWGVGNLKKYGLDKAPEETKNFINKYMGTEAVVEESKEVLKEVIADSNSIRIPLSNSDFDAVIDKEDYNKVKDYTWRLLKDRRTNVHYVATSFREGTYVGTIRLHRLVMDAGPDEDVHHIDFNPLNNKKENLELLPRESHRWRHSKAYQEV